MTGSLIGGKLVIFLEVSMSLLFLLLRLSTSVGLGGCFSCCLRGACYIVVGTLMDPMHTFVSRTIYRHCDALLSVR